MKHTLITFVSTYLQRRMNDLGLSIRDLAEKTGLSYEHSRKLVVGLAFPSAEMIDKLVEILHLSKRDLERYVSADRLIKRYGKIAWTVFGIPPRLGPLAILSEFMSAEDRETMLEMLKLQVRMNKKHGLVKA